MQLKLLVSHGQQIKLENAHNLILNIIEIVGKLEKRFEFSRLYMIISWTQFCNFCFLLVLAHRSNSSLPRSNWQLKSTPPPNVTKQIHFAKALTKSRTKLQRPYTGYMCFCSAWNFASTLLCSSIKSSMPI